MKANTESGAGQGALSLLPVPHFHLLVAPAGQRLGSACMPDRNALGAEWFAEVIRMAGEACFLRGISMIETGQHPLGHSWTYSFSQFLDAINLALAQTQPTTARAEGMLLSFYPSK